MPRHGGARALRLKTQTSPRGRERRPSRRPTARRDPRGAGHHVSRRLRCSVRRRRTRRQRSTSRSPLGGFLHRARRQAPDPRLECSSTGPRPDRIQIPPESDEGECARPPTSEPARGHRPRVGGGRPGSPRRTAAVLASGSQHPPQIGRVGDRMVKRRDVGVAEVGDTTATAYPRVVTQH